MTKKIDKDKYKDKDKDKEKTKTKTKTKTKKTKTNIKLCIPVNIVTFPITRPTTIVSLNANSPIANAWSSF